MCGACAWDRGHSLLSHTPISHSPLSPSLSVSLSRARALSLWYLDVAAHLHETEAAAVMCLRVSGIDGETKA